MAKRRKIVGQQKSMKLRKFIEELQAISNSVDKPEDVEVTMADYIPVVKPIYKKKTVFITDIEPEITDER